MIARWSSLSTSNSRGFPPSELPPLLVFLNVLGLRVVRFLRNRVLSELEFVLSSRVKNLKIHYGNLSWAAWAHAEICTVDRRHDLWVSVVC